MTLEVPLWIQNGVFPSYSDRTLISTLFGPGIPDPPPTTQYLPFTSDLQASISGLTITVAPGTVVIQGTDQTRQGNYLCRSTDNTAIQLDARPASGSRLDLIYARVIDTSTGVIGTDGWIIDKISGTAAAQNPTLPAAPSSSERLAQVLVPSGAGAIVLTDLRRRGSAANHAIGYLRGNTNAPTVSVGATFGNVWTMGFSAVQGRMYRIDAIANANQTGAAGLAMMRFAPGGEQPFLPFLTHRVNAGDNITHTGHCFYSPPETKWAAMFVQAQTSGGVLTFTQGWSRMDVTDLGLAVPLEPH